MTKVPLYPYCFFIGRGQQAFTEVWFTTPEPPTSDQIIRVLKQHHLRTHFPGEFSAEIAMLQDLKRRPNRREQNLSTHTAFSDESPAINTSYTVVYLREIPSGRNPQVEVALVESPSAPTTKSLRAVVPGATLLGVMRGHHQLIKQ